MLTVTHQARALQPGELVILTIASDTALSTLDVNVFGRVQRVQALPPTAARPHAWIALVGIDLDVKPGAHTVSVAATSQTGAATATHRLNVTGKVFSTRRLVVNPTLCPSSERGCAHREGTAAMAVALEGTAGPNPVPELRLVRPVPMRPLGLRHAERLQRQGAQVPQRRGLPEPPAHPSRASRRKGRHRCNLTSPVDGCGPWPGVVSLLAHMSKILVKGGDDVTQGKWWAGGSHGTSNRSASDWTVSVNGARVDPPGPALRDAQVSRFSVSKKSTSPRPPRLDWVVIKPS